MEMEQSLKEDIGTLEVLFRLLRDEIYLEYRTEGNELRRSAEEFEEPVISLNYGLSKGFKISEKENINKSSERSTTNARLLEISMKLLQEPIEIVCMNLLIAMIFIEEAHCLELQEGEKKVRLYTSRNGYYKKKAYQEKCKLLGIVCEEDEKIGFANEKPTEEFITRLKELNVMNFRFVCKLIDKEPTQRYGYVVYQCPECRVKVRGTRKRLHLICNDVVNHASGKSNIMIEGGIKKIDREHYNE